MEGPRQETKKLPFAILIVLSCKREGTHAARAQLHHFVLDRLVDLLFVVAHVQNHVRCSLRTVPTRHKGISALKYASTSDPHMIVPLSCLLSHRHKDTSKNSDT